MQLGKNSNHSHDLKESGAKPHVDDSRRRRDESPLLPIVVLHGGPGFPHPYLLPLRQQACRGREIVFYDQAGCGQSSFPLTEQVTTKKAVANSSNASLVLTNRYPWLLDPWYYATNELPALLSHLGLDQYHLLGHSWGSMLAQLFALDAANTTGLESMVLLGPLSDSELFERAMWDHQTGNLGTLPPFVQSRIHDLEANGLYDSLEYKAVNDVLTGFFTC